jgi:stearoyl-CoA desaturase (delta-9 desaturase)
LWSNPISFREECYVIPHRIHHAKPDEPGDPYGPHLGWLGSYLATETQQKTNRHISRVEFDRLTRSLDHIGFVKNSYEQFQRTGSVENIWHYGARVISANLMWSALMFAYAGRMGVLAWFSGVFLSTFVLRDFNFRGHAGLFGTDTHGNPLNQVFYGFTAGEWHENHHQDPGSARSGREWWQIDVPYLIIRGMRVCGMVTQVNKTI